MVETTTFEDVEPTREQLIVNEMKKHISERIEEVTTRRLKELGLYDKYLDHIKQENIRFPKFMWEVKDKGDIQSLYYDNGTLQGFRVVSFFTDTKSLNIEGHSISYSIQYM